MNKHNQRLCELVRDAGFFAHTLSKHEGAFLLLMAVRIPRGEVPGLEAKIAPYYFVSQKAYRANLALCETLHALGYEAKRAPDTIFLKPIAQKTGLGSMGMNTICINPQAGPFFHMEAILLSGPFEEEWLPYNDVCTRCGKCAEACPTGALDGKGGFNKPKCLRNHMMRSDPVPEPLRPAMGDRLLGCTACQDVCPIGKEMDIAPVMYNNPKIFDLACLLDMLEDPYSSQRKDVLGPNYARKKRLAAQAALIAANTGRTDLVEKLEKLRYDDSETVQEHACWALAQLTGGEI